MPNHVKVYSEEFRRRFWSKVSRRGATECWPWVGSVHHKGYGGMRVKKKLYYAHRLSWELHTGQRLKSGECVCHHCDRPSCVNPAHLFVGSKGDNLRDAASKLRLCKGEDSPLSKLTEEIVQNIRKDFVTDPKATYQGLGRKYGITDVHVGNIIKRKVWRHLTDYIPDSDRLPYRGLHYPRLFKETV